MHIAENNKNTAAGEELFLALRNVAEDQTHSGAPWIKDETSHESCPVLPQIHPNTDIPTWATHGTPSHALLQITWCNCGRVLSGNRKRQDNAAFSCKRSRLVDHSLWVVWCNQEHRNQCTVE